MLTNQNFVKVFFLETHVERISNLQDIKKAEFKRKQAPPILKLSSQSLGSDWRVPIAISY